MGRKKGERERQRKLLLTLMAGMSSKQQKLSGES